MRELPNTTRSIGYGETSWETGDLEEASPGKIFYKDLIAKANTVPLNRVFKYYGVKLDVIRSMATCPFKSHKGGRENSASFRFFSETNSFYCYGCKVGGEFAHACEFVSNIESISKVKAAFKIIDLFKDDVDENGENFVGNNFSEMLEIMMDFSLCVRNFRKNYLDDKSQSFIEKMCLAYDSVNARVSLDNDGLRNVVDQLKEHINSYKS